MTVYVPRRSTVASAIAQIWTFLRCTGNAAETPIRGNTTVANMLGVLRADQPYW